MDLGSPAPFEGGRLDLEAAPRATFRTSAPSATTLSRPATAELYAFAYSSPLARVTGAFRTWRARAARRSLRRRPTRPKRSFEAWRSFVRRERALKVSLEKRLDQLRGALERLELSAGPESRTCDRCAGRAGVARPESPPARLRKGDAPGEACQDLRLGIRDLEARRDAWKAWWGLGCRFCARGPLEVERRPYEEERSLREDQSEARCHWSGELGLFLPPNWVEWYESRGRLEEVIGLMRSSRLARLVVGRLRLRHRLTEALDPERVKPKASRRGLAAGPRAGSRALAAWRRLGEALSESLEGPIRRLRTLRRSKSGWRGPVEGTSTRPRGGFASA